MCSNIYEYTFCEYNHEYATDNQYFLPLSTGGIGLDFTIVSETLTFAVGATASQFVSIPINDDEFVEGEETFEVDFSSTNNRVSFSPGSSIEIIIEDNDGNFCFKSINLALMHANLVTNTQS